MRKPLLFCLAFCAHASPAVGQQYTMQLSSTEMVGGASGTAQLHPAQSPFGASVTPAGHLVYTLSYEISGLPDPSSLGPYTAYVAWAATPFFEQVQRLGSVRNGISSLGAVHWNKFRLIISVETTDTVSERRGPVVLRGLSPAFR